MSKKEYNTRIIIFILLLFNTLRHGVHKKVAEMDVDELMAVDLSSSDSDFEDDEYKLPADGETVQPSLEDHSERNRQVPYCS